MEINFRAYHYRAMNARTEEEKEAINAELKALYEQLDEDAKKIFNEKLQDFLISEYAKIKTMAEQVPLNQKKYDEN